MNDADRTQLAQFKEQQARLENDLRLLSQQLRSLEERLLRSPASTSAPVPSEAPLRVSSPPPALSRPATPAPVSPPVIAAFSLPNPIPREVPKPEPVHRPADIGVGAQPRAKLSPVASTTQTTASLPELKPVTPPAAPGMQEPAPGDDLSKCGWALSGSFAWVW